MSDTTATATTPPADAPAQESTKDADATDWKAEARKWEQRAKDNKSAADELAQIRESQKSEAEKVAERLAEAEKRASDAEARAQRRDIALEFKLSKDDAGLLDSLTDEAAMRTLAERLAAAESSKRKTGNISPREGTANTAPVDPKRAWLRENVRSD